MRISFLGLLVVFIFCFGTASHAIQSDPPPAAVAVFAAIDRKTKLSLWKYKSDKAGYFDPLVVNSKLFLYDFKRGVIMRIDPLSGALLWQLKLPGDNSETPFWARARYRFNIESIPDSPLLLINRILLVDESSGKIIVQSKSSIFELFQNVLLEYANCSGESPLCSRLIRRNPNDGSKLWEVDAAIRPNDLSFAQQDSMLIDDHFLLNISEHVSLVDLINGHTVWKISPQSNYAFKRLDLLDHTATTAPTVGNSILLKENERSTNYGGVFRHQITAVELLSGKRLWTHDLLTSTSIGNNCTEKCETGAIRKYTFASLKSGLAFYDGRYIVLAPIDGITKPKTLWPTTKSIADSKEVAALQKVGEDSVLAIVENLDKTGDQVLRLESNGVISWSYKDEGIATFSSSAVTSDTIKLTASYFDKKVSGAALLRTSPIKLSLGSGAVLASSGPNSAESNSVSTTGRYAEYEKAQNQLAEYAQIANQDTKVSGILSFENGTISLTQINQDSHFDNFTPVSDSIMLLIGNQPGSEVQDTNEPQEPATVDQLIYQLDSEDIRQILMGLRSIDKFPASSKLLMTHASRAALNEACANHACIHQILLSNSPDLFATLADILDKGSSKTLESAFSNLASTEKVKSFSVEQQQALVSLAIRALTDTEVQTRWRAARFLMFMDMPTSKITFKSYISGLIATLDAERNLMGTYPPSNGFYRKHAEIARTIGYLDGCGSSAWPKLLEVATTQLSVENKLEQDVAQTFEDLSAYQQASPVSFIDFVTRVTQRFLKSEGALKDQMKYPLQLLFRALSKHPDPRATIALVEFMKDAQIGGFVADSLRYSPPSLSISQIEQLLMSAQPTVRSLAAVLSVAYPARAKDFSLPAIKAILASNDDYKSRKIANILDGFRAEAKTAVALVLAEASPEEKMTLIEAIGYSSTRKLYLADLSVLKSDTHVQIKKYAERLLDLNERENISGTVITESNNSTTKPISKVPEICQ